MKLTKNISEDIIKQLDSAKDFDEIIGILKKYSKYELKSSHLGRAFEKMFVLKKGFSTVVSMEELEKYHHSFHTSNGGDWCRTNVGYLGAKYNIVRENRKGKIYSIKTDGINKKTKISPGIRNDIFNEIRSKRCVILDVSTNIECDHKDGMKDDWRLNDKSKQKLEDFQPLSKASNDAKRQHCKKCLETNKRYDAKLLGYKESYIYGSENSKTCVGCYWHNPKEFNEKISENFKKIV